MSARHASIILAALAAPLAGFAAPAAAGDASAAAVHRDAVPGDAQLTGRDIYAKVLENRLHSFVKETTMASADRSGRAQETRLHMAWQDFRDENGEPIEKGVLSKAVVKYTHPFDIRHSGYLVIQNDHRPNDQFVYFPERRKVMRVNLRSEAVFGTDFSFEDILPHELQDATYERREDTVVEGAPVFAIEATPTELANSEYSRLMIYVEKERFVPLLTRYWDTADVEVKELRADREAIRLHDEVWVPMRLTMRHLLHETSTRLEVTRLEPNPKLPRATFALQRLEAH